MLFILCRGRYDWRPCSLSFASGSFFWENSNLDFLIQKRILLFGSKSKNGSWIHKIHTQGGFFGSNPNPDFWDSQSERFFGKGFEKSIFDKRFFEKKKWYATDVVHVQRSNWTYNSGALLILSHYLHIIPCLSSIQIIGRLFLNPYLSCFLYVWSVCLRPGAYADLFST